MMIVDDAVGLVIQDQTFNVPAYVGNAESTRVEAGIWDVGIGAVFNQNNVRVMVPLPLYDPDTGEEHSINERDVAAVDWRGRTWTVDGPPVVSRVHGVDHHVTFKLATI